MQVHADTAGNATTAAEKCSEAVAFTNKVKAGHAPMIGRTRLSNR
jgi:hypothetical protein